MNQTYHFGLHNTLENAIKEARDNYAKLVNGTGIMSMKVATDIIANLPFGLSN